METRKISMSSNLMQGGEIFSINTRKEQESDDSMTEQALGTQSKGIVRTFVHLPISIIYPYDIMCDLPTRHYAHARVGENHAVALSC